MLDAILYTNVSVSIFVALIVLLIACYLLFTLLKLEWQDFKDRVAYDKFVKQLKKDREIQ